MIGPVRLPHRRRRPGCLQCVAADATSAAALASCVASRTRALLQRAFGVAGLRAQVVASAGRASSRLTAGAMGDDAYFESYGDLATHEVMLKDEPRMAAYAAAVEANADFIKGRVVLDVGAGTGILSLLCARAGARAVYAVEASPMAEHMRSIVELNGFADVITVFQSPMEETTLPEQVDVCISEWMGFHLLHEASSCCCALCLHIARPDAPRHARRACWTACC